MNPLYVESCVLASSFVWFVEVRGRSTTIVTVLEAAGIGCYAVVGALKAQTAGVGIVPSIILGAVTATFGGIVSDALAGRQTVLARKEIYVTAALLAATAFRLLTAAGVPPGWSAIVGAVCGAALRMLALALGWTMHAPPSRCRD